MLSAPRPVWVSVWVRENRRASYQTKKCEKSPEILRFQDFSGCGGRTRTYGLRVMSPTSYQLLHSAIYEIKGILVPVTGLEPVQYRYRGILSPLCLPIPPHRQISATDNIPYLRRDVNTCLQKTSPSTFCSFDLSALLCYAILYLYCYRKEADYADRNGKN